MKKLFALLLTTLFCLFLAIPVFADSGSDDLSDEDLSDAYISFSEQLSDKGISASTCLEDFIAGFKESNGTSIDLYIEVLIDSEMASSAVMEATIERNIQLADNTNDTVTPYSLGGNWYDDIGISNPKLPQAVSYNKYSILSTVTKGDIIHETTGGCAEYIGHIAIVEGKFWDSTYEQYYIRTIEAVKKYVTHGVLDDSRYDDRGITIYHIPLAISPERSAAVSFCMVQLGKEWTLIKMPMNPCSSSSDTQKWYCSELVWAAYYNQGYNLNGTTIPNHYYTPNDLSNSSLLSVRKIN